MKSASCLILPAQILRSFSTGRNGHATPGRLRPLWSETMLELDAGNDVGIGDLDDADRDVTKDQQAVAGKQSPAGSRVVTDEFLKSRGTSWVVMVKVSPIFSSWGPSWNAPGGS